MLRRPSAHLACVLLIIAGSVACKEDSGIEVTSLKFRGAKAVTSSQLESVLATVPSDRLLGVAMPWGTKRYFSREQFDADLRRIVAFYLDRGYPDARVASFDASLSQDQKSVSITIEISEGEPIRIERIEMAGMEPIPAAHLKQLEGRLALQPGAALDRALLQATRETALDELRDHGYPYASVRVSEEPGSSGRLRVLHLRADPGPVAHHGPVEINGNSSVSDNVVRRQLTYRPGDLYRQSRLVESQRRLYSLETFDFVNVEPQELEARAAEIPTRVTLTEGKHRKLNVGVGYGSEEKARAEVDWRHVNFFGGARTAGVFARYSSLDRGVRLNFKQPYLFGPRFSLTVSGQSWHNDEPAFVRDTLGGRFTVTRQFGFGGAPVSGSRPSTTASFTYSNEWEEYEIANATLLDPEQRDDLIAYGFDPRCGVGPRFCAGAGQLSSVSIDAARNTAGNILDARRGYVATLHLEQAGRWLQGDFNFYEVTLEGRYYRSVANRAVIALRARAGSIDGLGIENEVVPFFKRYFLGGATNLRGWGRFDVSPLSGSGVPIGGQTTLNFSTELRVPVWGKLSGVLFLDGGNVWVNPWDFNVNDLRYDAGPGLRYDTPIGPIRVDLGYQLNRIDGLLVNGKPEPRRFRLHFSIGQAF